MSHYENVYGTAVRSLNATRDELNALDLAAAPAYKVRALKRDELAAAYSVTLHELCFGSASAWRREFIALAHALAGCSVWVLLSYARGDGRPSNQIALDHSPGIIDALPVIAIDMYEHAYFLDFGANASAFAWYAAGGARALRP